MQTGNGEDLMTLEQEITELQRENARVESQMIRLKSDINAMETHLSHGERVRDIKYFLNTEIAMVVLKLFCELPSICLILPKADINIYEQWPIALLVFKFLCI